MEAPVKQAKSYKNPPAMVVDQDKQYSATIETDKGNIRMELYPKDAPRTVNNFVFLAREGYFDGVVFHRVVPGFVIQGGDPTGTGAGGPGYKFADEPVTRDYKLGTVAMANAGPNTNGSQFFICLADQPTLPKNYTIFGQTVEGIDVVQRIAKGDVMRKVTIEEK
jgi:cyclophilin family peptidyl-prolyl cis-trans isomerase